MTDDSELEQRLRRDLAELGAVPATRDRERRVVRRRLPGATLMVALAVVLALVGASFAIVRSSDHPRRQPIGSDTTKPATTNPTTTTATPLPEPPPPNCCTTPGDKGILEQFAPTSASAWWVIVGDNLKPKSFLVRTVDGGRHWRDVKLPVAQISSVGYFLNADVAWVKADELRAPDAEPIYRTLDGGRSWKRLGALPTYCRLQFLDRLHGWCSEIGGAMGSASVRIFRTSDGGATWTLVSYTSFPPNPSSADSLPFGGEKTINFTSPSVGWAPFYNAGGLTNIYGSEDGGSRWHELGQVPLPAGASQPVGSGLSPPVVQGSNVATVLTIGGPPGGTAICTSTDGGRSWRSQLIPGAPKNWNVDLIDPTHWRVTDGSVFMVTDDAGAHWRTSTPAVTLKDELGNALTLKFLSPLAGWAVPGPDGGPFWRTADGGATWRPVTIVAGPYRLPATK